MKMSDELTSGGDTRRLRSSDNLLRHSHGGDASCGQVLLSYTTPSPSRNRGVVTSASASSSSSPRLHNKPPSPFLRKPPWAAASSDHHHQAQQQHQHQHDHHHGRQQPQRHSPPTQGTLSLNGNDSFHINEHPVDGEQQQPQAAESATLHRHLTLFDLISVGIGATVGSGIFVLCGLIARNHAGPATFLSWLISGAAACLSGLCYAELSGTYPTAGSSYTYAYVSMGELPAVLAAACLTLEYVFSASAVARSWGDKVVEYVRVVSQGDAHGDGDGDGGGHGDEGWSNTDNNDSQTSNTLLMILDPGWNVNPMAALVSIVSVLLLLDGVKESKMVTNIFTTIKVALVLFMSFGGLMLLNKENLRPLIPPEFGWRGVFRGATSSFFGYIGYDEICCMAGEAINPAINLPRAVLGSLAIVTALYMLAAVALTGMVPYEEISDTSGFPDGFGYRGREVAAQISALGELITLPLVVLVTIMAQPRLQYAMAIDGLLPPIFAKVDPTGNLWHGTVFSGVLMIIIATFVPFTYLDDLISSGILVAFIMTDCSIVLLKHESPEEEPYLLERLVMLFNVMAMLAGWGIRYHSGSDFGRFLGILSCITLLIMAFTIGARCPRTLTPTVGGDVKHFRTPLVPYLPLLGVFVNWYLIAQLEASGLFLLLLYLSAAVTFYFCYGARHSVGNSRGWGRHESEAEYETLEHRHHQYESDGFGGYQQHQPLKPMISLPRVRRGDPGYAGMETTEVINS